MDVITIATPDWFENGVPYGSFCKCSKCGFVGRSIALFDFYADNPGDSLVCGGCLFGEVYPHELVKVMEDRGDFLG